MSTTQGVWSCLLAHLILGSQRALFTPVLLPGQFHGQKSLVEYSLQSRKELDMTEQLTEHPAHYTQKPPLT